MGDPTSLRLFSDALSDLEQSLGSVGGLRERPEKAWSRRAAGRDKRSVSRAPTPEQRQPVRQLAPGEPEAMAAEGGPRGKGGPRASATPNAPGIPPTSPAHRTPGTAPLRRHEADGGGWEQAELSRARKRSSPRGDEDAALERIDAYLRRSDGSSSGALDAQGGRAWRLSAVRSTGSAEGRRNRVSSTDRDARGGFAIGLDERFAAVAETSIPQAGSTSSTNSTT
ncbi:hypothetical protein T492DRAFT_842521 [Pavlovales sp. CCMP2436]|nr:hypothetical protein T492DRAFT_842521 [Pavlovales sp. CCMP2436]